MLLWQRRLFLAMLIGNYIVDYPRIVAAYRFHWWPVVGLGVVMPFVTAYVSVWLINAMFGRKIPDHLRWPRKQ